MDHDLEFQRQEQARLVQMRRQRLIHQEKILTTFRFKYPTFILPPLTYPAQYPAQHKGIPPPSNQEPSSPYFESNLFQVFKGFAKANNPFYSYKETIFSSSLPSTTLIEQPSHSIAAAVWSPTVAVATFDFFSRSFIKIRRCHSNRRFCCHCFSDEIRRGYPLRCLWSQRHHDNAQSSNSSSCRYCKVRISFSLCPYSTVIIAKPSEAACGLLNFLNH